MSNRKSALAASDPLRRRPTIGDMASAMLENAVSETGAALVPARPGEYRLGRLIISAVGLAIPDDPTDEELLTMGAFLAKMKTAYIWWRGDYEIAARRAWGSRYEEMMAATGLSYKTLANSVSVCRAIHFSRRRENLKYSHHVEVAHLEPDAQKYWLDAAERGDDSEAAARKPWSVRRLRREIYRWQHDDQEPPTSRRTVWEQQLRIVRGYVETIVHALETDGVVNGSIVAKVEAFIVELRASGKVR